MMRVKYGKKKHKHFSSETSDCPETDESHEYKAVLNEPNQFLEKAFQREENLNLKQEWLEAHGEAAVIDNDEKKELLKTSELSEEVATEIYLKYMQQPLLKEDVTIVKNLMKQKGANPGVLIRFTENLKNV